MLDVLATPAGGYVLSNAASSALGKMLVPLAKSQGLKTINLVRRQEHVQPLLDLGADHVIVTSGEEDVPARVKEITGARGAGGAGRGEGAAAGRPPGAAARALWFWEAPGWLAGWLAGR